MSDLKNLRALARGEINESAYREIKDANEPFELEDEEFMSECIAAAMPLYIQYELLGESAEDVEDAVNETFTRLQGYLVGQNIITEATVPKINKKLNVVHLNKQANINRLTKIITLKLARKANNKNYKKYKIGLKIKKTNMAAMVKLYGNKASRLAKKAWMQMQHMPKVNATVESKKKSKK